MNRGRLIVAVAEKVYSATNSSILFSMWGN